MLARRRWGPLGLALLLILLPSVAARAAGPDWSVTMFSDQADWIGLHQQRAFHPGNATIAVGGVDGQIGVEVHSTGAGSFTFRFAAAPGQEIATGSYDGAVRSIPNWLGRPVIEITGEGRGCNVIAGSFDVKEIVRGAGGEIERLWLTYEQHCEADQAALFGEIRYAMPPEPGSGVALSKLVRWPTTEVGRLGTLVPVTYVADAATSVDAVDLAGPGLDAFSVEDQCSGAALAAGESCTVWIRPDRPVQAGDHDATVTLVEHGGASHEVALEAPVAATLTQIKLLSEQGDWTGQGNSFVFDREDRWFHVEADRSAIHVEAGQYGVSVGWETTFAAPAGEFIRPGHYTGVVKAAYPYGPAPGLESVGAWSCATITGEFTIHELSFDLWGHVNAIDATFEQHCNGEAPALRGSLRYQASDLGPRDLSAPVIEPGPRNPVVAPSPSPHAPQVRRVTPPPFRTRAETRPAFGLISRRLVCRARTFARVAIVTGTREDDRLYGGGLGDLVIALGGSDRVVGRGGADCVDGGPGADVLRGGDDADVLRGGAGRDLLIGGEGDDRLDCGPGRDTAHASDDDVVRGCERIVHVDR